MTQHNEYYEYLSTRSRLGHLYRTYWLYPKLNRHLHGLTLDVGCGIGDMLAFRPGTVGADINPRTVQYCVDAGLEAKLMSPDVLPFSDHEFDSVLLDNVLEHIVDPNPLLSEIRRVLKIGGALLVGVPGIRGWATDPDHKVAYDEEQLVACLKRAKFEQVECFATPLWRSEWLSKHVRQYCVYGKFVNTGRVGV
jgi:SAM-dependent methyltransferase